MAVEITTRQMALTRDTGPGGFMERLQATIGQSARDVLSEAGTTPYHQGRALYAQRVIANILQCATAAGPIVVMGINIISTTTYDEETKTSTCTATDGELFSQVNTFWNVLAGLDTPA